MITLEMPGQAAAEIALRGYLDDLGLFSDHDGVLFDQYDVGKVVQLVMGVCRPYVQAETLADLADSMYERGMHTFAEVLDMISFELREALDGRR